MSSPGGGIYQPPHRRPKAAMPTPMAETGNGVGRRLEAGGNEGKNFIRRRPQMPLAPVPPPVSVSAMPSALSIPFAGAGERDAVDGLGGRGGGGGSSSLAAALERAATEAMLSESLRKSPSSTPVVAKFSRKVFVGGLPPDVDSEELSAYFGLFGRCWVDWPHKAETGSRFPPKGYAFVVFEAEMGVRRLLESCQCPVEAESKFYIFISSPSVPKKLVQVRPWLLKDAEYTGEPEAIIDPRKTIFIGGVPRPLTARELAQEFEKQFGGVAYAGIDTDSELRYPKGAGRVAFNNHQSYIMAIAARYVFIQHPEASKRVEVKPYVLDDQMCDQCGEVPAPYFCPVVNCLQYYCHPCWLHVHSPGLANRQCHKPLVKEPGLSGEFQKLEAVGALGGALRSGSTIPVAPRRLPHVRVASVSPSRLPRLPHYTGGAPSLRPIHHSPRKLSASGSMLYKWTSGVFQSQSPAEAEPQPLALHGRKVSPTPLYSQTSTSSTRPARPLSDYSTYGNSFGAQAPAQSRQQHEPLMVNTGGGGARRNLSFWNLHDLSGPSVGARPPPPTAANSNSNSNSDLYSGHNPRPRSPHSPHPLHSPSLSSQFTCSWEHH